MSQHLREGWRRVTTAASGGEFYHGTSVSLGAGESLEGGGPGHYQSDVYSRQGSIYVTDQADAAFFYAVLGPFSSADFSARPYVYRVQASDPVYSRPGEWTVSSATVLADVTAQAKVAFSQTWERVWKPMVLSSPVGEMPTPGMIVAEFEGRLK